MPDGKRAAYRALVDRIRQGPGETTADQRARAFANDDAGSALEPLLGKVATAPARVTGADYDTARAAGFSEDQLFELVIAAAVGQSTRMYEAALAALDEATADGTDD